MSTGDTKSPVQSPGKIINDSTRDAGLSDLTLLARQAFEQQRRKQSVVLTDAILKIDPDNREAQVIRAWVQQDLKKQVGSVQVQIEEARRENVLSLWDRAERLSREVLSIDPNNEEAKALLAEIIPAQRALAEEHEPEVERGQRDLADGNERRVASALAHVNRPAAIAVVLTILVAAAISVVLLRKPATKEDTSAVQPATADTVPPESPPPPPSLGSLKLIVFPETGVLLSVDESTAKPVPPLLELEPGDHRLFFTAIGYIPQTHSETLVAGQPRTLAVVLEPIPPRKFNTGSGNESAGKTAESTRPGAPANAPVERPPARVPIAPPQPTPARASVPTSADVLSAPEPCLQLQASQALERLTSRVEPQTPQSVRPSSPVTAYVKITIDKKGDVKVGDMRQVPVKMIGPLKSAVEQWRFTPATVAETLELRCVETELPIPLNP